MQDLNLRPPACRATQIRNFSSAQLPAGQWVGSILHGRSVCCKASHAVAYKRSARQSLRLCRVWLLSMAQYDQMSSFRAPDDGPGHQAERM